MQSFQKGSLFLVILLALSSIALAQSAESNSDASSNTTENCAPPTYGCARSDLIKSDNLNPAPNVSQGRNTIVTPSDFNLPIVRVTDSTNYENRDMTTTMSGSDGDNIFNTDDTYLIVDDNDGWKYPVAFDPTTLQVLTGSPWNIGTNQVRWGGAGRSAGPTRRFFLQSPALPPSASRASQGTTRPCIS